jgi:hypothetical protein
MCVPAGAASQQAATGAAAPAKTSTGKSTGKKTGVKKHHKATTTGNSSSHKPVAGKSSTTKSASAKGKRSTSHKKLPKTARTRGQQKIDSERAQSIQEALIREHYMSGEASGTWNQASEDAMRRYQADHGWQSKTVPDSRALIQLGLGPSKDHLLNPESAMTTVPDAPRAAASTSATGPGKSSTSADPASSSQHDSSSSPQ